MQNNTHNFTDDWFSPGLVNFEFIKDCYDKFHKIIEIGSYEGRSTCWMLENLLADNGTIHCLDTFTGGEEHNKNQIIGMFDRFNSNIALSKKPNQTVNVIVGNSYTSIDRSFGDVDFVYIDGSHQSPDVLMDTCAVFPQLKSGGVILFDDYAFNPDGQKELRHPNVSINAFTYIFAERIEIIKIPNQYQFAIRKL